MGLGDVVFSSEVFGGLILGFRWVSMWWVSVGLGDGGFQCYVVAGLGLW